MLVKRSFLLIESLPIFYGSRSRSPSRRKNNLEPVKNIAYHCSQPKRSYAAVRNVLSHASLTSEATYKVCKTSDWRIVKGIFRVVDPDTFFGR